MAMMRTIGLGGIAGFFFSGCYSLQQGAAQAKLLWQRQPIERVISEGKESAERIAKLKLVKKILLFSEEKVGLKPGSSYQSYVSLPGKSVTYIVQAASKRKLELKTWWFPVVGSQPYLGYFAESDALEKQNALKKEGYDTSLGGVEAFSLLGYFSDPVYSSMLDGNDLPEFVELLIHESVHRTVYVPDDTAFNENLADFIAKKATVLFFQSAPNLALDINSYNDKYTRTIRAQALFKPFLIAAKVELEDFYKKNEGTEEARFLTLRKEKFDELSARYDKEVRPLVQETGYAFAFRKGLFNNASLAGMSLYEAKQQPLEDLYVRVGKSLPSMVQKLEKCLKSKGEVWKKVEECQ